MVFKTSNFDDLLGLESRYVICRHRHYRVRVSYAYKVNYLLYMFRTTVIGDNKVIIL